IEAKDRELYRSLVISSDSKLFAQDGPGGTFILRDVSNGRDLCQLKANSSDLTALAFAPDSRTAATSSLGGRIQVWDTDTGKHIRQFDLNANGRGHTAPGVTRDGKTFR